MATNFPTSIDALVNPIATDSLATVNHADQHTNANDAIEALEAKVGVTNSAVTSSLDYRVRNIVATTMSVDGPSSSSMTIGDWSTTPAFSGIEGNMGYLLLGKNALDDYNIYLHGKNSVGGVNIGANNTTILNVNVNGINVTGTATISGSSTIGAQSDVSGRFSTSGGTVGLLLGSLGGTAPFVGTGASYPLSLNTNGVARLEITAGGQVGIGVTPSAGRSFTVGKNITGYTTSVGIANNGTIQNDVTVMAVGYRTGMSAIAPAGGLPLLYHYQALQGGYTGTVSIQAGFQVDSAMTGASNNYGFQGSLNASAGTRFNLFMDGTAPNYLAGRLGVGSITTSGAMAVIQNQTAADTAFIVQGAAAQSGDYFHIYNSAGASQFKVNSSGHILVNTTSARSVAASLQDILPSQIYIEQIGSSTSPFTAVLNRNDTNGVRIILGKSRGTTTGAVTALSNGDTIAQFMFAGADGTTLDPIAAQIRASVDGAVSTGVVPGRLAFNTANSAGTLTERMRITSAGLVGIGVTPTSMLHVVNATASDKALIVKGALSQSGDFFDIQDSSGTSQFKVDANSAVTIAGDLTVDTNTFKVDSTNNAVGINGNAIAGYGLRIASTGAGTGTTGAAVLLNGTVVSTMLNYRGVFQAPIYPAAMTASTSYQYLATSGVVPADSSIGTVVGFRAEDTLSSPPTGGTAVVTNTYAFQGAIATSGTTRYNLYMSGTAQNYLAGNLGIGVTVPTSKLHVVGSFSRGAPVTKTADFTLADTENWIICNGTAGIVVTLPAASTQVGREISLKNIAAFTVTSLTANVVPLAGGTAGTAILPATAGSWAKLVSNGTSWVIMQS